MSQSNYLKYRGNCKKLCETAIEKDSDLRLVRGYYHDVFWGKQEHWWTIKKDDTIHDQANCNFQIKMENMKSLMGISIAKPAEKK